ncbi:Crp/Fnr family transcriptional regulator [Chlorogloeopsis sp. ULAP01]|uniref:Crp/Fnr family transcriptional regulator n=1 Tax=Chlorogloeopsis sp. ULAP01 TaxID=3056483 RepID=UPI0025AAA3EF|nr:Crp/Fnr family transcriptional regulator [Chlorogloeopsis sp. ULAP01]MDM9380943.1 Crp/Fnr family transcriptional regulator [Chlorogloeopsis sp. ULAP01]
MSASQNPRNSIKNQLLAALPPEEYERLLPYMELVSLDLKQILYAPNEPIQYVYFLNSGVGSLLSLVESGDAVEVGTVGNEGMVGLPVFLGANSIPGEAIQQIPGEGMRMRADVFQREVTPGSPLYKLLQLYTQALFNLIAQSSACNRLHSIEQRFCRWMLMTRDRVGADQFPLTQEFLAQMLGVRRASVSEVATTIARAGFISYKYGKMTILDTEGLESTSCECYVIVKREFERLLGGNSAFS